MLTGYCCAVLLLFWGGTQKGQSVRPEDRESLLPSCTVQPCKMGALLHLKRKITPPALRRSHLTERSAPPSFEALPDLVRDRLFQELAGNSLLAFMQTCKANYRIAQDFLARRSSVTFCDLSFSPPLIVREQGKRRSWHVLIAHTRQKKRSSPFLKQDLFTFMEEERPYAARMELICLFLGFDFFFRPGLPKSFDNLISLELLCNNSLFCDVPVTLSLESDHIASLEALFTLPALQRLKLVLSCQGYAHPYQYGTGVAYLFASLILLPTRRSSIFRSRIPPPTPLTDLIQKSGLKKVEAQSYEQGGAFSHLTTCLTCHKSGLWTSSEAQIPQPLLKKVKERARGRICFINFADVKVKQGPPPVY